MKNASGHGDLSTVQQAKNVQWPFFQLFERKNDNHGTTCLLATKQSTCYKLITHRSFENYKTIWKL